MKFTLQAIGIVHSPFKEKFGTPRQPGLIADVPLSIEILKPYDKLEAFEGIEQFSHLWLSFIFHKNREKDWSPMVRPPRLGGNETIGVFASRAPYRPNPLGLSVVRFTGLRKESKKLFLDIKGADIIDGTPVVDIKPYIPYSDKVDAATAGYAGEVPEEKLQVIFSEQAIKKMQLVSDMCPQLEKFIRQVIALDPRPAYSPAEQPGKQYGIKLLDFDVHWQVANGIAQVVSIEQC